MPRVLPPPVFRRPLRAALLLVTVFSVACSEPPTKEMHQAQGAIDAAKAAGAEQYAPDELHAAVAALTQYEAAVAARDFRLALASALDSRERAQNAAKAAVDARAKARGDAERQLAEATALVQRLEIRLAGPVVAKLPRRTLAPHRTTVASATTELQEARASLEQEDYQAVQRMTAEVTGRIQAALDALDAAVDGPGRTRRG